MNDQPQIRTVVRIESTGKATQHTRVVLDDGSELQGLLRIELLAVPGDVWRASIEVSPASISVEAEAVIAEQAPADAPVPESPE